MNSERGTRKRLKKRSTVYSDEDDVDDMDDDYELETDMRKQMEDKDADDDFLPASPPPPLKKSSKRTGGTVVGKKGKPKRGGSKGADIIITMKDERKIATTSSATPVTEAVVISGSSSKLTVAKKRQNTLDDVDEASLTDTAESQKTVVDATSSPEGSKSSSVRKKLPTIKKNKSLASTAPSSGPSTPSASSSLAAKAIANSAAKRTVTATGRPLTTQAADLNLSDSTIYNSLFKTVSCL